MFVGIAPTVKLLPADRAGKDAVCHFLNLGRWLPSRHLCVSDKLASGLCQAETEQTAHSFQVLWVFHVVVGGEVVLHGKLVIAGNQFGAKVAGFAVCVRLEVL